MKRNSTIILLSLFYFLISCGNDQKKQSEKEVLYPVNKLKPVSEKISKKPSLAKVFITKDFETNSDTKKKSYTAQKRVYCKPQIQNPQIATENIPLDTRKESNESLMTFVNLRKILTGSKIGQTLTQKQLTQSFEIPEEAVKLVKSITKTAEDEIAVKWRSTWLVEKVSDAKFKDGLMKITFKANKLYTSGSAIGIKYDKKIYTDLIIIGRSAYIPSVKGYSWEIGK
jgi:hypothetical protein